LQPTLATRKNSGETIQEHVDQVVVIYTRRSTRSSSVDDGKNNVDAEATKKMEETKKQKQQKIKAALKNKRF